MTDSLTEKQAFPLVSVIMPIRNEAAFIERSLGAALAQDYPPEQIEVLVVDGISDDGTRSIVGAIARRDARVRLIDNPARYMAPGFNTGLRHARGDIIIMLGGHTEIAPDYIRNCVRLIQQKQVDCVGGAIETVTQTNSAAAIAVAMSSPFGVGGVAFRIGSKETETFVDTVPFGAYTREILDRAGFLDEELVRNQDDEYNYRLRKIGGRILLSPSIRSRYFSRSGLRSLWSQWYQYGFWKIRVLQKHPRQMQVRQFVPPGFTAALLGSVLLAPITDLGRLLLALVVGSYIAVNFTASVWTAHKQGWHYLWLLPAAFATIHLGYGLGFLVGLVKFANRWQDLLAQGTADDGREPTGNA